MLLHIVLFHLVLRYDSIDMPKFVPAELSDELAECAVQRFSEANFSRITNKNGFFMGIIRRVKQDGPDRSGGDLKSLPRAIRHKLQDLIDDVSPNSSQPESASIELQNPGRDQTPDFKRYGKPLVKREATLVLPLRRGN
jgi:hypothetical protein